MSPSQTARGLCVSPTNRAFRCPRRYLRRALPFRRRCRNRLVTGCGGGGDVEECTGRASGCRTRSSASSIQPAGQAVLLGADHERDAARQVGRGLGPRSPRASPPGCGSAREQPRDRLLGTRLRATGTVRAFRCPRARLGVLMSAAPVETNHRVHSARVGRAQLMSCPRLPGFSMCPHSSSGALGGASSFERAAQLRGDGRAGRRARSR